MFRMAWRSLSSRRLGAVVSYSIRLPARHPPRAKRRRTGAGGGKRIIRVMFRAELSIVTLLSQGEPTDAIHDDHPELEPDDIPVCLAFAHAVIAHNSLDAVRRARQTT